MSRLPRRTPHAEPNSRARPGVPANKPAPTVPHRIGHTGAQMNISTRATPAQSPGDRHRSRPALGRGPRARSTGRRQLRLLGAHDGRVLPTELRRAPGAAGERRLPRHAGRRRTRRLPRLPAVQARRTLARGAAGSHRHAAVPPAGERRTDAHPGAAGRRRAVEPLPPAPRVQAHHRADAEGLCGRTPRPPRAGCAGPQWQRHRGHLRGGLQLRRPLLCRCPEAAGHDADPLARRRRRHRAALRGRAVFAGRDPRRAQRGRHLRDRCSATIRTP